MPQAGHRSMIFILAASTACCCHPELSTGHHSSEVSLFQVSHSSKTDAQLKPGDARRPLMKPWCTRGTRVLLTFLRVLFPPCLEEPGSPQVRAQGPRGLFQDITCGSQVSSAHSSPSSATSFPSTICLKFWTPGQLTCIRRWGRGQ